MTNEEIRVLDMEQLEERAAEIASEVETADAEAVDTLSEELDVIEERKQEIRAEAEEKRAAIEAVIEGEGEEVEVSKEERTMTNIEVRNTPEYLDAWVENLKGMATEEQRALLTENAEDGTVAIPVYVEERIETAWEENAILRGVKKSFFKGIVKVGVEMSASGAVIHDEGDEAVSPEELVLAYADLVPQTIKKLVEVSDEVLDFHGEAMVDYLVDEINYQLAKKAADEIVGMIVGNLTVTSYTAAGAALTTADIIGAEGDLAGEANPVVITTRAAAAALKAAALSAQYGYDPFDGLEVIYVDSAAITGALAIVADLTGIQANFPNGYEPRIKFDEMTKADADMVRIIGRLPVGIGIVNFGKVVKIVADSE